MADSSLASVCPICGSAEAVHSCHATDSGKKVDSQQTDVGGTEAEVPRKFVVIYLGSAHLDRRFPPQSSMPWVMGEIKRSRDTFKEVSLEIMSCTLKASSYEGSDTIETVFEHKLHSLSRFAKTHQDPRCFAYLRRQSLYSNFECHAFLANEETVVLCRTTNTQRPKSQISQKTQRFSTGTPSFGRLKIEILKDEARGFPHDPPKSPALRQSSYPTGVKERILAGNKIYRHSMPLPVQFEHGEITSVLFNDDVDDDSTASSSDDDSGDEYLCDDVPELFKCIRGATQRDLFEEANYNEPEPAKACYEVMYVGRAKVKGKKIFSNHVDDLVRRLDAKDTAERGTSDSESPGRRRHKSDTSVRSLPSTLDDKLVKENELQKVSLKLFKGAELHNDSPTGSNDDVHRSASGEHIDLQGQGGSSDHLSDSSAETISDKMSHCSSDDQLKGEMFTGLQHGHDGHQFEGQGQGHPLEGQDQAGDHSVHNNHAIKSSNRTMLFRVGVADISLISPDRKQPILERKFKNISSVSQVNRAPYKGNIKADTFGFISREPGSLLICHLLRCCSPELVDEIMQALRTSFQTAYEQSRLQTQQICINCPLQQYHILCQDINGLPPELAYNLLCKRIQQLPEKEATELYNALQNENPQSHEESVEALMISIRKICEQRQREHSHISDSSRGSQKSDFYLADLKIKPQKSAFDSIRNRAKKTLATSFESLLSNVHNKTEEVKEAFRHRSGTTDSEGGSFSKSVDYSTGSTPEASPAPSPAVPVNDSEQGRDHVHFDFPSPPPSPTHTQSRPRSSTVGAVPDAATITRVVAREEQRKKAELKEQEKRRASESPMKHMFILANASSPRRHSAGPGGLDEDVEPHTPPSDLGTPRRQGSWRQAIFNRVVTPARHPRTPTLEEQDEEDEEGKTRLRSSEEIRALWKKAILETLLLIRMEKENLDLRARQDEMQLRRQKLDYEEITPCLKEVSRTWDEMLNTPDRATIKFGYEKLLDCVKQGVPQAKRGDIWWFLVEQHRVMQPALEEKAPKVDYQELLKQLTTHQHAIIIDLGRTFPGHPYFSMQLGNGQLALFNLLKAYSLMDTDVGYCQGLSFVAGILLMHMEEVQAFEAWKHVMYNLGLRKQYRPNMIALQIQLYQLTRLLHDNYRDLYDHFEEHEIAPTLYAAPWFLTLFASQFPLGFVARVFDLIFVQGVDVIFKVALVLLGSHKELIMQCDSFETIVEFIKTTLPAMGMIQMERIVNQAFNLDIGKQLQSYEVEYHVLKEEMMYSPVKGEADVIAKMEAANRSLKQQNLELLEKLQQAHSHERSLDTLIHSQQAQHAKLKSHVRTLELERAALLNAVTKLKRCIPEADRLNLDLSLPDLTPSFPASPVHYGTAMVMEESSDSKEAEPLSFDRTKSARFHPEKAS